MGSSWPIYPPKHTNIWQLLSGNGKWKPYRNGAVGGQKGGKKDSERYIHSMEKKKMSTKKKGQHKNLN